MRYLRFCFIFLVLNHGMDPATSIKCPPLRSLAIPPIIAPPTTTNPVNRSAPRFTLAIGMPFKKISLSNQNNSDNINLHLSHFLKYRMLRLGIVSRELTEKELQNLFPLRCYRLWFENL